MSDSLYQQLGVKEDASPEEIKRAYRILATQYHPDKNPGDATAEAKFKEIAYAYRVLKDPGSRLLYDSTGMPEMPPVEREIQNVLLSAFQDALKKGADLTLVSAREFLQEIQSGLMEQKDNANKSEAYLKEKRSLIDSTDGNNLFHMLIDGELKKTASAMAMINYRLDVIAGCFKRLEGYSSKEKPPPPPKGFAHEFVIFDPLSQGPGPFARATAGMDFEKIITEELRKQREKSEAVEQEDE